MMIAVQTIRDRPVRYRPDTSDERVLKEVIDGQCYRKAMLGFEVEEGEHWLDLGANIGAFALYCHFLGATADCYEPDGENFEILCKNLQGLKGFTAHNSAVTVHEADTIQFYKGTRADDRYRYTAIKSTRPYAIVPNIHVSQLFKDRGYNQWDGCKLDIEGSELLMLDDEWCPPARKVCMEYHLTKDPCMKNFRRRMKFLRSQFRTVSYIPSLDQKYEGDKYPGFYDRLIFCMR
jgi:FkbM family methyltransferase